MMTRGGEGGKKCQKFDDVICERPLMNINGLILTGPVNWNESPLAICLGGFWKTGWLQTSYLLGQWTCNFGSYSVYEFCKLQVIYISATFYAQSFKVTMKSHKSECCSSGRQS